MRGMRAWAHLLGVERAIVEDAGLEEATGAFVVSVRLRRRDRHRCGICRRRSPGYDGGEGRRRWRAPDLGLTRAYLEADAPRATMPAIIQDFIRDNPGVRMTITELPPGKTVEAINRGDIDLGFPILVPGVDLTGLDYQVVCTEQLALAVAVAVASIHLPGSRRSRWKPRGSR